MNNLSKAFGYLIAGQTQAVALIIAAWFVGEWLNSHYPQNFSWYVVTIPVGVLGVAHTFYILIKYILRTHGGDKKGDGDK